MLFSPRSSTWPISCFAAVANEERKQYVIKDSWASGWIGRKGIWSISFGSWSKPWCLPGYTSVTAFRGGPCERRGGPRATGYSWIAVGQCQLITAISNVCTHVSLWHPMASNWIISPIGESFCSRIKRYFTRYVHCKCMYSHGHRPFSTSQGYLA